MNHFGIYFRLFSSDLDVIQDSEQRLPHLCQVIDEVIGLTATDQVVEGQAAARQIHQFTLTRLGEDKRSTGVSERPVQSTLTHALSRCCWSG